MKISLNWIKEFTDVKLTVDELVEKIGAQLGAVEEVENLGEKYKGAVIVKVVSVADHPNADRLHVCTIDDGGNTQGVNRDEKGFVQVVCGAPNVHEGMLAVWLPPNTIVPNTYDKEQFKLEAREIRGVVSNGMLASAHELAISDDHTGIVEIDPENWLRKDMGGEVPHAEALQHRHTVPTIKPGQSFVETYKLDDTIIDIENKMFTHRPDCFGILGVAREVAGIQHLQFSSPVQYKNPTTTQNRDLQEPSLQLEVKNGTPDLVPRFIGQVFGGVNVGPSDMRMQSLLTRVGLRPINNVVDITNYFMVLTGQPMHAYDADKLAALAAASSGQQAVSLETRMSRKGDKLRLLNGKEIELQNNNTILITSNYVPVGIGGVMGGADTEVDENTKNIVLECASFDMYTIRRTSMELGLFTDAVTRFTKGQSPLQNDRIVNWARGEIIHQTAGNPGSYIDVKQELPEPATVRVSARFINDRLGTELKADEAAKLLQNVEFDVKVSGDELEVIAPFWRTDIAIPEDIVEEVGRLYGYDHLPLVLPKRDLTPAKRNAMFTLKTQLRNLLSAAGANEVLTYSFVHGNLLEKVGQNKENAYQVANAISPDLQYYRMSLTPSLLDLVHANIKSGQSEFALFELNKIHVKSFQDKSEPELPGESNRLALVFAADDKTAKANYLGAPYYQAKRYLKEVIEHLPLEFETKQLEEYLSGGAEDKEWFKPFEPKRSTVLVAGNKVIGVVGEYKAPVKRSLKLPEFCAGFEISLDYALGKQKNVYAALPRFPKVEQDICLKVSNSTTYQQVYDMVKIFIDANKPENTKAIVAPLDIFQKDDDKEHKQITLRLSIANYERTMTDQEVNKLLDDVASAAKEKLSAERI